MTLQKNYTTRPFYPQAIDTGIVIQESKDEILVYNLRTNKAACLNETSKLVFNFSDGTNSVDQICRLMEKELRKTVPEDLVWLALDQLASEDLLINSERFKNKVEGLSRRDVIRRVGLATMVALPLISSIIAPSAVVALSSGIPPNAACNSDCTIGQLAPCVCNGAATCGPNATISGTVGVGVCLSASVAIGTGLSGGVNANVCLFTNVCVTI